MPQRSDGGVRKAARRDRRRMPLCHRVIFCSFWTLLHVNDQVRPSTAFLPGPSVGSIQRLRLIREMASRVSHVSRSADDEAQRIDARMPRWPPMASAQDDGAMDRDGCRRRQLLLSMLAMATGVPPVRNTRADSSPVDSLTSIEENAAATAEFVNVIRPPTDDRAYEVHTLGNGLRVLLCSDPSSNDAAAAMDVHVGACADPAAVRGLAHFTEHMLFLGTQRYPREDSFEAFLAANGGRSNAYTDAENTVYYFDLSAEEDGRFAEGLRRFGSFFAGPLFTESATDRELNAIESENAKNLQSDTFRYFQMAKSRANRDHPFSNFFTGNRRTLLDDTRRLGINLREELLKFYEHYYSANQMTLAVVGPQSIDKLKQMVLESFLDIPNREVSKPEESWLGVSPFASSNSIVPSFGHVVEIVPVQDLRQLSISWPVIYRNEHDRDSSLLDKPSIYIAHLLGHEGPRSLLSYLKQRGWANSVATATEEQLSDFETFEIVVGLTKRGLVAVDDVVEVIYAYLSLLRNHLIPSYVFDEVLQLDELQWRFATKGSSGSYAQGLATSMQKYPAPLYVAGPRRLALSEFEQQGLSDEARTSFSSREQLENTRMLVSKYLDDLTVDNALLTVMSKSFEGKTNQKEIWYGTDYRARQLDDNVLNAWRQAAVGSKLRMDFPKPNRFIPSELGLRVKLPVDKPLISQREKSFENKMEPPPAPRVIRDDDRWKVYFKADDRFGQPKGYVIFELITSKGFSNPLNAAISNLYELVVSDKLGEYSYDASLAGLVYEVKVLPRGVRLTFGGYNDKLRDFAAFISKKLNKKIADILPKTDAEFDRYKDQILRALSAFDFKQPYAHASYYAQITLQPHRFQYDNSELLAATRRVSLSDLLEYSSGLWYSGKGEALIQGNFNENEALDLINRLDITIPFKSIDKDEYPPRLVALPLPQSKSTVLPTRLVVAEPNTRNENSVGYVLIQSLGKTEKEHVMIELISAILEEPFYNSLRTKQQLGYIVSSGLKGVGETRTLSFVVQSAVATADKLTLEILKFLDSAESNILDKLPKGDLAVYIKSLIDRKTEPDKDLIAEVTRNWSEISSGRVQFDRIQREAASLLDIDKDDLLKFWKRIYSDDDRRVLICEIIPRSGPASSELPAISTGYSMSDLTMEGLLLGIDDLPAFRHDRERLLAQETASMAG